ncbi:hypothetical protein [Sporosarcina trichiuri]|uniref:hypothetical protein n=1 Tax=Sporosarcina trichiuri TaxID=3056445 RepID=UPI0025B2A6FE|nr:hypothetical protein [Sporosarcina sp. 0.2-SM1T-5]WJY27421.1 hypothetical protein QWT68_15490 [Sporosarcina sp. 0.2-SM1T-5]WJY27441.1 hypothetical protein QWT68_00010 [Sporosarcina sp. 0.2-SM1T-5]
MEHESVERTLRTGYPEAEARLVTHCGSCGGELYEKEEVLLHDEDVFCDNDCLLDHLIDAGHVWVKVLDEEVPV